MNVQWQVTLSKHWALGEAKARDEVDGLLDAAGLTVDAVMAETLANNLKSIERIDYLIASAEARRHNVLREIERHRQALAAALRSATDEAVDAEFREIAPTASTSGE
jgi:ribosomal protein L12E/L44/L45/RPP1/RPP2